MSMRVKRLVLGYLRRALLAYVRAQPRPRDLAGADRRVTIWLLHAFGMGGTIRTVWNLAGWLAANGYDVEILSTGQGRQTPFFGELPPGVRITSLDDRRMDGAPHALVPRLVREVLRAAPSVLLHPAERSYLRHNLWTDVRLARLMRRRTGFLIGTRPGLNAAIARLRLPGTIDVGQEHMHFGHHVKPLRRLIRRTYPQLDAVAMLTDRDRREYAAALKGDVRLVAIANAAREMGGPPVDLSARTVLAAGRLGNQKGFDLLIAAFARIAAEHPDWRLRIHGKGGARGRLKAQIRGLGLTKQVSIEGPAAELGNEMAQASIYALSSRFEGFPLILIEAMSKGMAVCAFDCPTGPGEIIDDHRNGILVPAEDVAALAAGLSELMADEDLRRRCAAAAAETAAGYTMDAIGRRWDTLLRELWAERAGTPAR